MKKFYALLLTILCSLSYSQTVLYHENFDPPSYRDSTFTITVNGVRAFDTTSQIASSQPLSYHTKGYTTFGLGAAPYFRTTSFSTVGQNFVVLTFKHIAKTAGSNRCRLSISKDNGITWQTPNYYHYQGKSQNGGSGFASDSYSEWQSMNDTAKPKSSWWKEETFVLNDLANTVSGSTVTGAPNVMVRFYANFTYQPLTGFAAGWFIDDIKVTGYSCENIPPTFSTNYFVSPPCYRPFVSGYVRAQANNSYPIGVRVVDAGPYGSGVGTVRAYYQVKNGGPYGPLMQITMPPRFSVLGEYHGFINNIYPGDTVRYYIAAVDQGCPTTGYLPEHINGPAFNTFFVSDTLSAKCGMSVCGAEVIQNFPWKEDFDRPDWQSGVGNGNSGNYHRGSMPLEDYLGWQVIPSINDIYGWSVNIGATGTSLTGPVGDASPNSSGRYLFTEFSQGPVTKNSKLITPCIDLRDSIPRLFTFDYHMYGAEIENLRIDIDTGLNSSVWITGVGLLSGQQQSAQTSPWKNFSVDLSPYIGRIIKIRFNSSANLPGDKKDVAIDNLEIRNIFPVDAQLLKVTGDLGKPCGGASNIPVNISVVSGGSSTLTEIPVAYQFNMGTIIRDTIRGLSLGLLDTTNFTFPQQVTFNGNLNHLLKIWVELPLDTTSENDTLILEVPIKTNGVINTFPYIMDFEAATMTSGNTTLNLGTTQWFTEHQQGSRWALESYSSNDYEDGPTAQYISEGNFLMIEKPQIWQDTVILRSGCIDLSTLVQPILSFEYFNGLNNYLTVLARAEDGEWELLSSINNFFPGDSMQLHQLNLKDYAGKTLEIMFYQYYTSVAKMPFALDNIVIGERGTTDLSLLSIGNSIFNLTDGDVALNSFDIVYGKTLDSGNSSLNAILRVQLKNRCNSAAPVITGQVAFSVFSGMGMVGNQFVSPIALNTPIAAGEYELKLWISTTGDAISANDTVTMRMVVPKKIPVPYFNNFENCEVLFIDTAGKKQWEFTTPPGGAHNGQKAAITNDFKSLPGIHYLNAPTFNGLDTALGAELRFWHRHNFNNINEYGQVEYYRPTQGWLPMHYANSGINAPLKFTDSVGWSYSSYPLDHTTRANGELSIRFKSNITTTAKSGWAIDDFEIFVPTQISAAPNQLLFVNGLPEQGLNDIALKFYNSGRRSIDTVTLTILDQTGRQLIKEKVHFAQPLQWKQEIKVNLQSKLSLDSTIRELTLFTSFPNNRNDALPKDDTLKYQITFLKGIDSLPYCNDFEGLQDFISFNEKNGSLDTIWQQTSPQKHIINTAHSGNKVWITHASHQYPPLMNRYLYTPFMSVRGQSCYQFSFWHIYDTERNFDGGFVEYTLDSGLTWKLLGSSKDSNWYNTAYVQSLDGIKPGFSGQSNGWQKAQLEFQIFWEGIVQFRFRFAANATISGEGWAIDDLCLVEVSGSCQQIGLNQITLQKATLELFPNPANNAIGFTLNGGKMSFDEGELKIYDYRGQLVKNLAQTIIPGRQKFIDISNLAEGVYSLSIQYGGDIFVKNFVKLN